MVNTNSPWIESPFFEEILKSKSFTHEQLSLVKEYHENGFVVVQNLIPLSLIDAVREDCEKKAFNPEFPLKSQRDEKRVQDFWMASDASKELAAYQPVLAILKLFYNRNPIPFQTLNFRVGSQQRAHSDTIHFSSLPAKFMCGVWVALQDITDENGPVFYYPGSQKLPEYNFSHIKDKAQKSSYEDYRDYEDFMGEIVDASNISKKKFLAKKGDILIWSSNIIHGGSPVTAAGSTRWSQVTHYFFEDCYYYTPMLSNMITNELYLRKDLVNIKTGEKVEQNYNGEKLNDIPTGKGLYILNNTMFKKAPKAFKLLGKLF